MSSEYFEIFTTQNSERYPDGGVRPVKVSNKPLLDTEVEDHPQVTDHQRLIMNGLPRLMGTHEREIIPICGRRGSGKSTLIDYLLGCEMKVIDTGSSHYKVDTVGVPYARIGHSHAVSH